ncbi:MAG TPA: SUMF1/EgtB/PvdO family nonheme iron enzyme [bacterium]|nr:SUMF1/EgtB/PvdO family nonheme iron enzyme [bacterium]
MRKALFAVVVVALALVPVMTLTAAKKKPKVAVMEIEDRSKKFDADTMANATDIFRSELSASQRFVVIDKTSQQAKMKEAIKAGKKESFEKCQGRNCEIPLGQTLAADNILKATVSCLGKRCTLAAEMISIAKEATVAGATGEFDGTPEGMLPAIKKVVREMAETAGGDYNVEELDVKTLYEQAMEADKNGTDEPEKAIEAWKKVEEIDSNNPYKTLAKTKAREWQTYINQKAELEKAHDEDVGKLIMLLPDMSVGFEAKKKALLAFKEKYAKVYGENDYQTVLMAVADQKLRQRLEKAMLPGAADEAANSDADMVTVPAGAFTMGCKGDGCPKDAQPPHKVYLAEYKIDKYEVSQEKYRACVDAGKCPAPADFKDCNWAAQTREDHPVNCVAWKDADAFCKWQGKRLPTEAEWEKAARGEKNLVYPWGEQTAECRYAVIDMGTPGCQKNSTHEIKAKDRGQSPYGLFNMIGNVAEWVADWYDDDYPSGDLKNPTGPKSGKERILRGGSWKSSVQEKLKGYSREKATPGTKTPETGIRCAK